MNRIPGAEASGIEPNRLSTSVQLSTGSGRTADYSGRITHLLATEPEGAQYRDQEWTRFNCPMEEAHGNARQEHDLPLVRSRRGGGGALLCPDVSRFVCR